MNGADQGPSRWYYLLALAIFLAGLIAMVPSIIDGIEEISTSMHQVVLPDGYDLILNETGTYTVFYQYEGVHRGIFYSSPKDLPPLELEVRKVGGPEVPTQPTFGQSTMEVGGSKSRSIFQFQITEPGIYNITSRTAVSSETVPSETVPIVLLVGKDPVSKIFALVGKLMLIVSASSILSLALAALVYKKRREAKRRNEEELALMRGV